jgi:heterodisulfide reductase subunit D
MNIKEAIKKSKAYLCLECGKCTGVCPISKFNRGYSPRILVNKSLRGNYDNLLKDKNIWNCLTCRLCDEQCPVDIDYINLTQAIRLEAQKIGEEAMCSHGGAVQSLMHIMTAPNLQQKRMDWVDKYLKISDKGEVLYFVGCLPYFDALFAEIGVETLKAAQATVKILNHLGVTPVILPQERCCGHDLLWSGDLENFKRLAEYNINEIKKSGAKKIIFSCPEGYRTFKLDYPKYFSYDFEVKHITEVIGEAIANEKLKFKNIKKKVTFQDACRLGRHLGIYDAPRQAIASIPDIEFLEMPRTRNRAICCGVSAWMNCSTFSKSIQLMRLKEAKKTGANLLIVSCPKCEIHFNCAMKDEKAGKDVKIETIQLVTLVADAVGDK